MSEVIELKKKVISAGYAAVEELIKVAREPIITDNEIENAEEVDDDDEKPKTKLKVDLSADRLKNAAQAKRIAIEDSFAILKLVSEEEAMMSEDKGNAAVNDTTGFAERNSKKI